MNRLLPRPLKVEQNFTDARLTGFGDWSALALTAERLGASDGLILKSAGGLPPIVAQQMIAVQH